MSARALEDDFGTGHEIVGYEKLKPREMPNQTVCSGYANSFCLPHQQLAGDSTVNDGLPVYLNAESVSMGILSNENVLADFFQSFFEAWHFFVEMADLSSEAKLRLNVLSAKTGQTSDFGVNSCFFNHER